MSSYDPTLLCRVRRFAVFNLALLSAFALVTTDNRSLPVAAQANNAPASVTRPLALGATIKDELRGGQTQTFQLALTPAQFARLTLRASHVELAVKLSTPAGQPVLNISYPRNTPQPVPISLIAGYIGAHRLEITSREKEEVARPYEIRFEESRLVTKRDAQRVAADWALAEGENSRSKETEEERRPAIAKHEEAVRLYRALDDRAGEAHALYALGRAYNNLNDQAKAIAHLDQALPIRRELKDRAGEADTQHALGGAHNAAGNRDKALAAYQESLRIRRELQDRRGEATALFGGGQAARLLNKRDDALKAFEQALQLWRETKDQRGQADALAELGVLMRQMSRYDQAQDYYQQSLAIYQKLENKGGEANINNNLAVLMATRGKQREALPYFERVLETQRSLGQTRQVARTTDNIASMYDDLGEPDKALEYYRQALQIRREVNDRPGLATTLNNLGEVHSKRGETQLALEYLNEARPLLRATGGVVAEARAITNLGNVYRQRGDRERALDYFQQALIIWREAKDLPGQAATLNLIGNTYLELGEQQSAREHFEPALELWRKLGNPPQEATVLGNLGVLAHRAEDKAKALTYLNQALALVSEKDDARGVASRLNQAAPVYSEQDDHQQALALLQRALPLTRQTKTRGIEAETLHNLGWEQYKLEQPAAARDYFNQALKLYRELGVPRGVASTLFGLAQAEMAAGDLNTARTHIEAALKIAEELRANVSSQRLRVSYFASVQKYYEFYIELLMKLYQQRQGEGLDAAALQASEQARARGLLDLLSEASSDLRLGVDEKLLASERDLQQQLNIKAQRRSALLADSQQSATLKQEIEALTRELQNVRARIRNSSSRYAALTQPQPLTLKEIQQQALDDDTLLLEYALGDKRSFLWAVTPTTLKSYVLPRREEIETAARDVYEALTARNYEAPGETAAQKQRRIAQADAQLNTAARRLSRMVLAPAARELGRKRLVIVAQGALQYVPFGMLPTPPGGRVSDSAQSNRRVTASPHHRASSLPLIAAHEIISLPSASTLAVLRREMAGRQPATKTLAVFADPVFEKEDERVAKLSIKAAAPTNAPPTASKASVAPKPDTAQTRLLKHSADKLGAGRIPRLPFTRQEAEEILALVPAAERHAALDFAANRQAITAADLKQYRYVHFATHGVFDSEYPELSAIVLSLVDEQGRTQPDGFLRAHEVYNLTLPADVVVLSACETGLGKEIKGEGLVGLTRGFMYAGAPRVVVSLWAVNDRATAALMTQFYGKMLKEGLRPAAALRAAQAELRRDPKWAAPYYWASFTLQGEWR